MVYPNWLGAGDLPTRAMADKSEPLGIHCGSYSKLVGSRRGSKGMAKLPRLAMPS